MPIGVIRHPLRAILDHQQIFIENLIKTFSHLYKDWENEEIKKIEEYAKTNSGGDSECEYSIYSQISDVFVEQYSEVSILFYNSMLVLVYSYYEAFVNRILDELKINCPYQKTRCRIDYIMQEKGGKLKIENKKNIDYLEDKIRILRNNICHNNQGTTHNKEILNELAKTNKEIFFYGDAVCIEGHKFILDVLEIEYNILIDILDNTGYEIIYPYKMKKDGKKK